MTTAVLRGRRLQTAETVNRVSAASAPLESGALAAGALTMAVLVAPGWFVPQATSPVAAAYSSTRHEQFKSQVSTGRQDFAGIHDPIGIKGVFDRPHQVQFNR